MDIHLPQQLYAAWCIGYVTGLCDVFCQHHRGHRSADSPPELQLEVIGHFGPIEPGFSFRGQYRRALKTADFQSGRQAGWTDGQAYFLTHRPAKSLLHRFSPSPK